jgi:hypothetical protein
MLQKLLHRASDRASEGILLAGEKDPLRQYLKSPARGFFFFVAVLKRL